MIETFLNFILFAMIATIIGILFFAIIDYAVAVFDIDLEDKEDLEDI